MKTLLLSLAIARLLSADPVTFNRDVRPILSGKCFKCHGPDIQEGGLRLDQRESATSKLESGVHAILAGEVDKSEVIRRIDSDTPDIQMPPPESNFTLSDVERERLRTWIKSGASYQQHWAYEPPSPLSVLNNHDASWPRSRIDARLLVSMEAEGFSPSKDALPATLLRRASLDLVGLPPTLQEREAYLADDRPDAFDRLVDRLLASPQHGVRQAIDWLDLARYADTDGYALDFDRSIWPYRDWVIDAFNANIPFNRFTIEQLAGDLLPEASVAQRIATGLHRNTRISTEAGSDPEEYRIEAVLDRVNTTATIWLGSTLSCAQCHSHKFDPFTQTDYYRLYAYFNNDAVETERNDAGVITNVSPRVHFLPSDQQAIKDGLEARLIHETDPTERKKLEKEIAGLTPIQSLAMQTGASLRKSFVFIRGSFLTPGEEIQPGVPESLTKIAGSSEGNDRLALARWLVSRRNPLTARVMVNRWFNQHMGVAFVETLDDLGTQSPPVRHQDVLDDLAIDFMDSGWDMKRLHRTIVTSAAYRQSSETTPRQWERDPGNRALARASRVRLSAEIVRDNALAAAGILSERLGGRPIQAARMKANEGPDWSYRRSAYILWKRGALDPYLMNFDAPTRDVCVALRERTSTPTQALNLLNGPTFTDAARALALRVLTETEEANRIRQAYLLMLAREPSEAETQILGDLLKRRKLELEANPQLADEIVKGSVAPVQGVNRVDWAAWTLAAGVLIGLDEASTRE